MKFGGLHIAFVAVKVCAGIPAVVTDSALHLPGSFPNRNMLLDSVIII